MLRNYLTVAIRNLMRHKTYSVINTLGLSVGMACGILILLFIQDEFKHASYHPNGHRIFKVWREIKHPAGKSVFKEWHEGKIALAMRDQFPKIQVVGRANASHFTEQWIRVAHKMRREFFVIVDSEFLVVYYTMNAWLQDFVYRIQLGIWPFLLGGVLSLVIALMTVSSQTIRAAISNPVDALRYE